jgi:quercetin dioxygenase-like cupin family protein
MNTAEFEKLLRTEGYDEITTKSMPSMCHNDAHSHEFDVKALVTDGAITLGVDGQQQTYAVGDTFVMPAGRVHIEDCGPSGVAYLVGRRHKPAR